VWATRSSIACTDRSEPQERDVVSQLTNLVVVLLASTAIYKVCGLRRDSLSAQFALAGVFVFLTLGVFPFTEWFRVIFDDRAAQGWGQVGARIFVVLAAGMAQSYLLLLARPFREVRAGVLYRLGGAGLIAAVLATLASVTPSWALGTGTFDLWTEVVIHLLFMVYLAGALADVAIAALRWARDCGDVVRLGLRLVAAGSVLGMAYAIGRMVVTFLELISGRNAALVATFQVIALLGLVLVAAGSALPGLTRSWRSGRRTLSAHRHLDHLYPLWSDLVAVVPGIALERVEPRWRDRLHFRDLDMRLYRRVIEIRDGQLAVACGAAEMARPVPDVVDLARSLSSTTSDAPTTVDAEVAWWVDVASSYAGLRRADAQATSR
jgi:hypothetical protein